MSLLWFLVAATHAVTALVTLAAGRRHEPRSAGLVAATLLVLASWSAASALAPSQLPWGIASGVGSAALGIAMSLAFLRLARGRHEAEAKAAALAAEAQAMVQEGSSEAEASRSRFRHLVDVTPLGIFEADGEGQYLFVSRRWRELTGIDSRASARGEGWLASVRADRREGVRAAWARATAAGSVFELEWPVEGSRTGRWVACRATPRAVPAGHEAAFIGILMDVTERKRLEEVQREQDASEAQKLKLESLGVMAGGIAHDFNNLLVGVLGNVELLGPHQPPGSEAAKLLARTEVAARRAADLAQQMLVFAGAGVVETGSVDLGELVDESLGLFTKEDRSRLQCEVLAGLPPVGADRTRLQQIFTNLARNALEASADSSAPVVVRAEQRLVSAEELEAACVGSLHLSGQHVVLEVVDQGCGIPSEDVQRVFDPFYSTKFVGRGLGLAVVAGAVRAQRISLALDSTPGAGTRVRLYLTVASRPAEVEASGGEGPRQAAQGHLLVVDDEAMVRETLAAILERAGYSVELAAGGHEALELLRSRPGSFEAVLLDLTMPGMDGRQTLGHLREIEGGLPVILLSGHAQEQLENSIPREELAGMILKPFRSSELLSGVERAIGSSPDPKGQRPALRDAGSREGSS